MSKKQPVMSHDPLADIGDGDEGKQPSENAAKPATATRRKRAPTKKKTAAKPRAKAKPAVKTAPGQQAEAVSDTAAEAGPVNEVVNEPEATQGDGKVLLPGSMTIMDVGELREPLLKHLEGPGPLVLDGSDVEMIEGAGIQLLASFFKTAVEKGVELQWDGASDALRRAALQAGLATYVKLDVDSEQAA